MNIVEISQKRYTTKHYDKSKKIPKDKLDQLLTVLKNSPSSVNSQPWHFYIIDNDAAKNKILPAITDFNRPRVTDSSHTIVFCIKTPLDEKHLANLNSSTIESQQAWEGRQLYIALGQLLFAAAAIGIDSTAIEGYDSAKMDEILGLKSLGLKSVVLASLGYRADSDGNAHRPKSRLPEEQIFTFL